MPTDQTAIATAGASPAIRDAAATAAPDGAGETSETPSRAPDAAALRLAETLAALRRGPAPTGLRSYAATNGLYERIFALGHCRRPDPALEPPLATIARDASDAAVGACHHYLETGLDRYHRALIDRALATDDAALLAFACAPAGLRLDTDAEMRLAALLERPGPATAPLVAGVVAAAIAADRDRAVRIGTAALRRRRWKSVAGLAALGTDLAAAAGDLGASAAALAALAALTAPEGDCPLETGATPGFADLLAASPNATLLGVAAADAFEV